MSNRVNSAETITSLGQADATSRPSRIKRFLPKTLFRRALLIIVTPLILMQAISTFVFFDRHWDTMTRRLAHMLAGDISYVVDILSPLPASNQVADITARVRKLLYMIVVVEPGAILANTSRSATGDRVERRLSEAMEERVRRPYLIDTGRENRRVVVKVQLPDGVLSVDVHEKRLYSFTPYIFLMWMVGSSLVLFAIAIVFMRNQIRPIRRLAIAARSFGMGREVGEFRPEGAAEVRQAAEAFRQMRERIQRQLTQRTEMLAGVSHDLRTPLTRMKLQLAMLGEGPEIEDLKSDVEDMEHMVEGYLAFARGEGTEELVTANPIDLVEEAVSAERRDGSDIALRVLGAGDCITEVRSQALKRAFTNLIVNAKKFATRIEVLIKIGSDEVLVLVDDNGPGIGAQYREEVFKPFHRLDPSRNPKTGGIGLGLTIARDITRNHGGDLVLEDSPLGGLRARLRLPL
ncbi:MAG: two-component sensor histidine kinase [Rhodospirillaceae bacterium]|nr:two-component sensor histidine kinase [Rhodospirillaceae bacterium]